MKWLAIKAGAQRFFFCLSRWVDRALSKPWRAFFLLYLFGILVVMLLHFGGSALVYVLQHL